MNNTEEKRLLIIKELAEKIYKSYAENHMGFMNDYVERIIKLTDTSYDPNNLYRQKFLSKSALKKLRTQLGKLENKKYINPEEKLIKQEAILFWQNFDYHYNNSSNFKIKADKIISRLYTGKKKDNNSKCFCGGDKYFKKICKECSQSNRSTQKNGN